MTRSPMPIALAVIIQAMFCRGISRWFGTTTTMAAAAATLVFGKPEEALAQTAPAIGTVITNVVGGVEKRYEVIGDPVYSLAQVNNPDLKNRKSGIGNEGVASAGTLKSNLPEGLNLMFYFEGRFQFRANGGGSVRTNDIPHGISKLLPWTFSSMVSFLENGTVGSKGESSIGSQVVAVAPDSTAVTTTKDPNGFIVLGIDLLDTNVVAAAKSFDPNSTGYLINKGPSVVISFATITDGTVTTRVAASSAHASEDAHGLTVVPARNLKGFVETDPNNIDDPIFNVCIGGGFVPLREIRDQVITLSTTRLDGGVEVTFTEKDSAGNWVSTELKGVANVEMNNALTGGWAVLRTVPKGAKGFKWEAPPEPGHRATFLRLRF